MTAVVNAGEVVVRGEHGELLARTLELEHELQHESADDGGQHDRAQRRGDECNDTVAASGGG